MNLPSFLKHCMTFFTLRKTRTRKQQQKHQLHPPTPLTLSPRPRFILHRTYFLWSGADLFSVTDDQGKKQIIVIETNSCPSGNKSLPLPRDTVDNDRYVRYSYCI